MTEPEPAGDDISIELGTEMSLQVERLAHRLHGTFIGMSPGHCVMVQVSADQFGGVRPGFLWRSEVIGRFVQEGRVFGFKCTFLDIVEFPVSMVFLSYPEQWETVQLRRYPRASCFLPASLSLPEQEGSVDAFILDISEGGCRCSLHRRDGQEASEPEVGAEISLKATLLGTRGRQSFEAEVRNVEENESGDLLVGLQFQDLAGEERSSVVQFILNTDSALRQRTFRDFQQWQQRRLPQDVLALYLDAYATEVESGDGERFLLLAVAGLDFSGRLDLLDMAAVRPEREKEAWKALLEGTKERGLEHCLVTVSGHRPNLGEAVAAAFHGADHQRSFGQLLQRARKEVHPERKLVEELEGFESKSDARQAVEEFHRLIERHKSDSPEFCADLQEHASEYLAFLNLPRDIRSHFADTAPLKELFSTLDGFRNAAGGRFESANELRIKAFWANWRLQAQWSAPKEDVVERLDALEERFEQAFLSSPNRRTLMKRASSESEEEQESDQAV